MIGAFYEFERLTLSNLKMSVEEGADLIGAYLLLHLKPHCEHCGVSETCQWRKGWKSDVLYSHVLLCNPCGIKYANNQVCTLCNCIYNKSHHLKETDWLVCSNCLRWTHKTCERRRVQVNINFADYCCVICSIQ